ncbi:hypothetical protein ACU3L3_15955 [Priestia endophytica]|uniref:Uncharacterized protein n=1 Tax=Priestia endophytica DSM 13796 TaxID=1121089 RepID=A0A1I6C3E6_9BACI|nr:hypothetical protein [Priestia endophytica]SFQ87711.1 hypothetical protein SAMN02745910_04885 [Priestia endophytica DSM 13796]
MTTITLKEIERRVNSDSQKKDAIIRKFESKLSTRNRIQGRVRPKHPTEARILSSFKRK